LAVALAECSVGGTEKPLGVRIERHEMIRGDALLFSESQSRIVVSLAEKNLGELIEIAARRSVPLQVIGSVGGNRFTIQQLVGLPVEELRAAWAGGLADRLQ
jgi:phosphoribosylformylglycinamidine synthase